MQNSSSVRLAIYRCSFNKVLEKPIFGYGWGRGNDALRDCFEEEFYPLASDDYNSHNQYLGYLLDGGLLAGMILIHFVVYFFRKAIIRKDITMAAIVLFYAIIMLMENILVRQAGIILFIFIFSFLAYFDNFSSQRNIAVS